MQIEEGVKSAVVDNSLRDQHYYSHHITKDKFHCFIDSFKILLCLVPSGLIIPRGQSVSG